MVIEKVTAFVVRQTGSGRELLLFHHPSAGVQLPAGTVEPGESPLAAVLREVAEETGLPAAGPVQYLGATDQLCPEDEAWVGRGTKVLSRPEATSSDWAYLRRGIKVAVLRQAAGFSQIHYQEHDNLSAPQYLSFAITGWVPDNTLTHSLKRHFFLLEHNTPTPQRWPITADNHTFTLFWAALSHLPPLISPQDQWVTTWLTGL